MSCPPAPGHGSKPAPSQADCGLGPLTLSLILPPEDQSTRPQCPLAQPQGPGSWFWPGLRRVETLSRFQPDSDSPGPWQPCPPPGLLCAPAVFCLLGTQHPLPSWAGRESAPALGLRARSLPKRLWLRNGQRAVALLWLRKPVSFMEAVLPFVIVSPPSHSSVHLCCLPPASHSHTARRVKGRRPPCAGLTPPELRLGGLALRARLCEICRPPLSCCALWKPSPPSVWEKLPDWLGEHSSQAHCVQAPGLRGPQPLPTSSTAKPAMARVQGC